MGQGSVLFDSKARSFPDEGGKNPDVPASSHFGLKGKDVAISIVEPSSPEGRFGLLTLFAVKQGSCPGWTISPKRTWLFVAKMSISKSGRSDKLVPCLDHAHPLALIIPLQHSNSPPCIGVFAG